MNAFFRFRARVTSLKQFEYIVMSQNNEKVYYAVGRGRKIGIYDTWKECKIQTEGISDAKYRKFFSLEEAQEFVNFWKNYECPIRKSHKSENSMASKEPADRTCEEAKNYDRAQAAGEKANLVEDEAASLHQQQSAPPVPNLHLQSPSKFTSFEGAEESRNVNVLALSLRLDSFEKRFDACLKEIGAIAAEISLIKSEVKEIKETLSSGDPASGSAYSPRKGRDGLLQTTLAFVSPTANKSPLKSYSTYQDEANSGEPSMRRGKNLKRKLSRSDSSEDSKRFADDAVDHEDLLAGIKPEVIDPSSFTRDEDDYVEVYTDGASHCNGKDNAKAGIGIWWGDHHPLNVAEPVAGAPTNNTAEIQAARVAMELAVKCGLRRLKILTDSEFLINCATRWVHRWKKNGWVLVNGGPVKNRKELEKLDKVAGKIAVRWEKVAGHAGIRGNEMADRLANEGASRYKR